MHKRTFLAAFLVAAPAALTTAAAYATVSDQDQASPTIDVVKADRTGDVSVARRSARGVPDRIVQSVEMAHVDYHVDRTASVVTSTYPLRRVVANDNYRQLVGTAIFSTKSTADSTPFVEFLSSTTRPGRILVVALDGKGSFDQSRCREATSVVDARADTVTQTVPFSCLRGALDHGYLRSFALLEKSGGADVSHDLTPYTRDLPLTTYVAPTDPGTAG